MAVLASFIGAVAVSGGLFGSLHYDTPSGPSIVVAALALFLISPRAGGPAGAAPNGRRPSQMTTDSQKLTRNPVAGLRDLEKAGQPLSAYTIIDQLRGAGLRAAAARSLPRVWRSCSRRASFTGWRAINSFVACAHPPHPHAQGSAFAICERCGRVDEFSDKMVEARLREWSSEHGLPAVPHHERNPRRYARPAPAASPARRRFPAPGRACEQRPA